MPTWIAGGSRRPRHRARPARQGSGRRGRRAPPNGSVIRDRQAEDHPRRVAAIPTTVVAPRSIHPVNGPRSSSWGPVPPAPSTPACSERCSRPGSASTWCGPRHGGSQRPVRGRRCGARLWDARGLWRSAGPGGHLSWAPLWRWRGSARAGRGLAGAAAGRARRSPLAYPSCWSWSRWSRQPGGAVADGGATLTAGGGPAMLALARATGRHGGRARRDARRCSPVVVARGARPRRARPARCGGAPSGRRSMRPPRRPG